MFGWFWMALSASALWGLTYVASQYMLRTLNPFQVLWLSSLVIFIGLGIFLLVSGHSKSLILRLEQPKVILTVIAYSTLYFAASFLILKSITLGNASYAALVESSYPLFTLFFAYILLNETQFNWGILLGCGFLITGLIIIQLYSAKG
ncbi:MAG: DMT family transporter [Gammaproteobacteria bacterium]|nr:DMT family transporter [Gammaproteobacteria bacterium]